jgi:hypothetical protein
MKVNDVDTGNIPVDWIPIAYAEYGRWYIYDNSPYTIEQSRWLEANDYITMTQKRLYVEDMYGNKVPTSKMELLIRKRR